MFVIPAILLMMKRRRNCLHMKSYPIELEYDLDMDMNIQLTTAIQFGKNNMIQYKRL